MKSRGVDLEGGGVGGGDNNVDDMGSLVGTCGEFELVSRWNGRHSVGVYGIQLTIGVCGSSGERDLWSWRS